MVSQRRIRNLVTLFIFISLFLVACERPLGGDDAPTDQTTQTDAEAGGGTDGNTEAPVVEVNESVDEAAVSTDDGEQADDTTDTTDANSDAAADESAETTDEEMAEETEESAEAVTTEGDAETTAEETEEAAEEGEETAADGDAEASTEDGDDSNEDNSDEGEITIDIPETHTVAEGENLYRIGLLYGMSWKAIAIENHLKNPHIVKVGQVLKLPNATPPPVEEPTPTPSPQTETTYVVKHGDTLFLIGKHFGISWVQIAEANGLVNPNLIKVGDELKIPVNTPGPAPDFTHVVKHGDTLFRISLQYGVSVPAIADANDLKSPYIIYVGQTLEIPGSEEVETETDE